MFCQRRAADRHKWNDERINASNASINEHPCGFVQRLNRIAKSRKEIGTDLSPAENRNRYAKGFEIERL